MSAKVIASFKVSKMMNIVGIGYIVAGDITEGYIEIGNSIKLDDNELYRIDAVEAIDYGSMQHSDTALILEPLDESSASLLPSLQPGQIIEIITNGEA